MWLIIYIILFAIMWYMVARDICNRFTKYKIINDEVSNSLLKFDSERVTNE